MWTTSGYFASFSMGSILYFGKDAKKMQTHVLRIWLFFFLTTDIQKKIKIPSFFFQIDVIHSLDGSTMNMLHGECYMLTPEILIHGHKSIFFFF